MYTLENLITLGQSCFIVVMLPWNIVCTMLMTLVILGF